MNQWCCQVIIRELFSIIVGVRATSRNDKDLWHHNKMMVTGQSGAKFLLSHNIINKVIPDLTPLPC